MSTKLEFAVQLTCPCDGNKVKTALSDVPGVENVQVDKNTNTVIVQSTHNVEFIQEKIRSTGLKAVLKGVAGTLAGVAIVEGSDKKLQGVVRFMQMGQDKCIIEGTVDGLMPGEHSLKIHESGDISRGCSSVGDCFSLSPNPRGNKAYGDLGSVNADVNGRATFRIQDNVINLSEIIGRSLVISNQSLNDRLGCGIIARSAGLFQNPKTICACDGVSIWDENKKATSVV